jgi:hypothetical protein
MIAKITLTNRLAAPKQPHTCNQGHKKEDINMVHLNLHYQDIFWTSVTLLLCEAMGSNIGPWDAPHKDKICHAWTQLLDEESQMPDNLYPIIYKLASQLHFVSVAGLRYLSISLATALPPGITNLA